MGFTVKDSGKRETFATGAVRDTEDGKPRIDKVLKWLPFAALERTAAHYEAGASKYGPDNWKQGIPEERCLSSAFRHLYQYLLGERDEDHLAATVFNVFAIMHFQHLGNLQQGVQKKLQGERGYVDSRCDFCEEEFKWTTALSVKNADQWGPGVQSGLCPHCKRTNYSDIVHKQFLRGRGIVGS